MCDIKKGVEDRFVYPAFCCNGSGQLCFPDSRWPNEKNAFGHLGADFLEFGWVSHEVHDVYDFGFVLINSC